MYFINYSFLNNSLIRDIQRNLHINDTYRDIFVGVASAASHKGNAPLFINAKKGVRVLNQQASRPDGLNRGIRRSHTPFVSREIRDNTVFYIPPAVCSVIVTVQPSTLSLSLAPLPPLSDMLRRFINRTYCALSSTQL